MNRNHKLWHPINFELKSAPKGIIAELSYSLGLNEGLNKGLNEGLNSVLSEIKQNEGIKAKELAAILSDRSIKTIERQIAELIKLKLIERRGSRKTGGYFVV